MEGSAWSPPQVQGIDEAVPSNLETEGAPGESTLELLKIAMTDMNLSARAYDRILKVGRTIADLASSMRITSDHLSEAIGFRSLDRQTSG